MIRRIFISSVQRELSKERKAIVDPVSGNQQRARFFSTFASEFKAKAEEVKAKTGKAKAKTAEAKVKRQKAG